MATTTNNQEFTLERFIALSNWDKEESELVFENVILDKYNSTRAKYESDEKWYLGESQNLRLSSAYFEIGYYKQAAKTSEYFLEKSESECKELKDKVSKLESELSYKEGELIWERKNYASLNDRYNNLWKDKLNLEWEAEALRDELNSIRA